MPTITSRIRRRINAGRVITVGTAIAITGFFLMFFLGSLGDSDLPPYDRPFPGEGAGWIIWAVISWPLVLVARIIGRDPPFIFWLPLLLFAGLFWAMLLEVCIMIKHGWKA